MPTQQQTVYSAEVVEVFSGDDLVLMVDLGVDNLHKRQRVRLKGVDTPNGINAAADTEAGKVRSMVRALVKGKEVTLTVHSHSGKNSWVGTIEYVGPRGKANLNNELVALGYSFDRQKA